jgi:hypothetical protein
VRRRRPRRHDGTLAGELTIAGTGGHHILSGAEAIARGRDPRFITTLLRSKRSSTT